jgi:hypothetical protein
MRGVRALRELRWRLHANASSQAGLRSAVCYSLPTIVLVTADHLLFVSDLLMNRGMRQLLVTLLAAALALWSPVPAVPLRRLSARLDRYACLSQCYVDHESFVLSPVLLCRSSAVLESAVGIMPMTKTDWELGYAAQLWRPVQCLQKCAEKWVVPGADTSVVVSQNMKQAIRELAFRLGALPPGDPAFSNYFGTAKVNTDSQKKVYNALIGMAPRTIQQWSDAIYDVGHRPVLSVGEDGTYVVRIPCSCSMLGTPIFSC